MRDIDIEILIRNFGMKWDTRRMMSPFFPASLTLGGRTRW